MQFSGDKEDSAIKLTLSGAKEEYDGRVLIKEVSIG